MAVAVVGSITSAQAAVVSSLTLSSIVVPATCDCMVVCVGNMDSSDNGANVTSIDYNTSEAVTEIFDAVAGDTGVAIGRLLMPTVTTADIDIVIDESSEGLAAGVVLLSGVDQTTPVRASGATASGSSAAPSVDVPSEVDDFVIDCLAYIGTGAATADASQTQRWNEETIASVGGVASSTEDGEATTTTMSWSISSNPWIVGGAAFRPVALTYDQEGYRWRADDGSESAATWLVAQDLDITRAKVTNTRIRVLTDAAGDPASHQVAIQYRKVGDADSEWRSVP